jgi:hypothetical protein
MGHAFLIYTVDLITKNFRLDKDIQYEREMGKNDEGRSSLHYRNKLTQVLR